MFKVNKNDTKTTPGFEHVIAGWELFLQRARYEMFDRVLNTPLVIMWKSKTRVTSCDSWVQIYELRIQSNELRVQIHKLLVQIHELWVQIHELRVQIHELRVQMHELRVRIHELRIQIHELEG